MNDVIRATDLIGVTAEIMEARTVNSKTFVLESGGLRKIITNVPIHYRDAASTLQDIILAPSFKNGFYTVDQAPYVLKMDGNAYYYSGEGGEVSVELLSTDFTDTEYKITPLPFGVKTDLILASDKAPRTWQWRISGNVKMLRPVVGCDFNGKFCQLDQSLAGDILTVTWSGMVADSISLRRGGSWASDVVYPVTIDPSVNETIGTNNDDGTTIWGGTAAAFQNLGANTLSCGRFKNTSATYTQSTVGLRFQTVDIPNAATINTATLTVNLTGVPSGSPSSRWYADDVDSAAAWGTGSRIKDITKTTAFTTFAPTTSGSKNIDVTAIVQELVNRAGWTNNNNMRFSAFIQNVRDANNHRWVAEALENAGTAQATLVIDYTAAGATSHYFIRQPGFTGGFNRMTGGFDG